MKINDLVTNWQCGQITKSISPCGLLEMRFKLPTNINISGVCTMPKFVFQSAETSAPKNSHCPILFLTGGF
jgi:hypothetical protein